MVSFQSSPATVAKELGIMRGFPNITNVSRKMAELVNASVKRIQSWMNFDVLVMSHDKFSLTDS